MPDASFVTPASISLAILIRYYLLDWRDALEQLVDAQDPRAAAVARQRRLLSVWVLRECHLPEGYRTKTLQEQKEGLAQALEPEHASVVGRALDAALADLDTVDALISFMDETADLVLPADRSLPADEDDDDDDQEQDPASLSPAQKAAKRRGRVQPESFFGLFLRKLTITFNQMMFAGVARLLEAIVAYPTPHHAPTLLSRGALRRFLHRHAATVEAKVGRQSRSETDHIMDHILNTSPSARLPEAHFVRYLNAVHHREFETALESLHRYFDHSVLEQRRRRRILRAAGGGAAAAAVLGRTSMLQYAILNLGMLHFRFGHEAEALRAVTETVRIAQQNNDRACLLHALTLLGWLRGAPVSKVRDAGAGVGAERIRSGAVLRTRRRRTVRARVRGKRPGRDRAVSTVSKATLRAPVVATPNTPSTSITAVSFDMDVMKRGQRAMAKLREMLCRCVTPPALFVPPGGSATRSGPRPHGGTARQGVGLPNTPSEVDIRAWLAIVAFDLRHGQLQGDETGSPRAILAALDHALQMGTYYETALPTDASARDRVLGTAHVLAAIGWATFGSAQCSRACAEVYLRFHASVRAGGVAQDVAAATCCVADVCWQQGPALFAQARAMFPHAARNGLDERLSIAEFQRALDARDVEGARTAAARVFALCPLDAPSPDADLLGEVLFVEARMLALDGRVADARSACVRLLARCGARADALRAARVLAFLARLYIRMGSPLEVLPCALQALSLCRVANAHAVYAEATVTLARVHLELGAPRRALETVWSVLPMVLGECRPAIRVEAFEVMALCRLAMVGRVIAAAEASPAPPLDAALSQLAFGEVVALLERARKEGEAAHCWGALQGVYYGLARAYHEVDNPAARDEAAARFVQVR